MRLCGWTLSTLFLISPVVGFAQTAPMGTPMPPVSPVNPANEKRLDELLKAWEDRMKGLDFLTTECTRIELDKTAGSKEDFTGKAMFLKPNLAKLELMNSANRNRWELYISNGQNLYEYQPKTKTVRVHDLPKDKAGIADDTFMKFLFGMKANDARKRYDLTLHKEDEWYAYVNIIPRTAADKQEFSKAQLVLFINPKYPQLAMLPARLWFEHQNQNEVTWVFKNQDALKKLAAADFAPPPVPKDWTTQRAGAPIAPPQPAPKTVRSSDPTK